MSVPSSSLYVAMVLVSVAVCADGNGDGDAFVGCRVWFFCQYFCWSRVLLYVQVVYGTALLPCFFVLFVFCLPSVSRRSERGEGSIIARACCSTNWPKGIPSIPEVLSRSTPSRSLG